MLIISDNLNGINQAIRKAFPYTLHQICLIHFLRNVKKNLPHKEHAYVIKLFKDLKNAYDFEEGMAIIDKILEILGKYNREEIVDNFRSVKEDYLTFLKFPQRVRKHIYTTNPVESIHSMYDKALERVGGYFKSERNLDLNIFITINNLNEKWKDKSIPMIKSVSYELTQMANFIFEGEEVE